MSSISPKTFLVCHGAWAAGWAWKKLHPLMLVPVGSTPESLKQQLNDDTAFWQPIVEKTGYKITN